MLSIGIIGDFDAASPTHRATTDALSHARKALGAEFTVKWVSTSSLVQDPADKVLGTFDAIWSSPGDIEEDLGAIEGIRFARARQRPFLGT